MKYSDLAIGSIFLFCFLLSCNQVSDNDRQVRPKFISEKFIPLRNKVFTEEIVSPDFINKAGDKMLVSSSLSDTMIHVYRIPDITHLYSFGTKGQGPDEITVFPMFCESKSNDAYIWGYSPTTIKKFRLSEDGKLVLLKDIFLPLYEAFNYMNIIEDRFFFYLDIDQMKIKKIDLITEDLSEISFEKDSHNESFYYANRGVMSMNDKYIVYAYLYKNQIDIYDLSNLKLYKRLITTANGLPLSGGKQFTVEFMYYRNIVTTNTYIYAYRKDNNKNPILEVYDYEGNPVNKYILEMSLTLFIVDEQNKVLIGYNSEYEDYFCIFDLDVL
jgi:hypothetical protein